MSTDQPIRLTLPPHLVDRIRAILVYDIARQLDESLKDELTGAVEGVDAGDVTTGREGSPSVISLAGDTDQRNAAATGTSELSHQGEEADDDQPESVAVPVDPPAPPTIAEETLEEVARWADTKIGRGILKRYNLAGDYTMISLLAGTQVYIPPSRLARLRAAEPVDKPNPYLPTYLSPQPPSIGREFSSLTKQLSTILNVLFSIFGSAFAVYVAGTTGAGYTREASILLGILAGAVVGVAEAVLVWIFSKRVKEGRKERWERGRKMARGSAGLGPKEVPFGEAERAGEGQEEKDVDLKDGSESDSEEQARDEDVQGERPGDVGPAGHAPGEQDTDSYRAKGAQEIRLRRRPIG